MEAAVALSAHLTLQAALQVRLGPSVAVVCTDVDGDPTTLWPEEKRAIAHAVPRRQGEFAAGRSAARAAMKILNWPAAAIPVHTDRSPGWPEGLVGSIAHTADTCVAVLGRRTAWASIGIDIEPERGIEQALWDIICTPDELRELATHGSLNMASLVTRVFVAKEAFYKWQFPQSGTFLDFQDVSVKWAPNGSDFEVAPSPSPGKRGVMPGSGQLFTTSGCVVACLASKACS